MISFLHYITCFITGMAVLTLELLSFRLFAPYFGTSSYVIGIIINVVLFALAIGYILGGWLSDRYQSNGLPYKILFVTSLYLIGVILFYKNILTFCAQYSTVLGTFLGVGILFVLPMIALAFIPPYIIKLLFHGKNVGTIAGKIYCLSTLGSIVGGILTTFIFIPNLGSRLTLFVAICLISFISIIGLCIKSNKALLGLFTLFIPIIFSQSINPNIVYKTETPYNLIFIREINSHLWVFFNNEDAYQSRSLGPTKKSNDPYFDSMLFPFFVKDIQKTLILGNNVGTSMMQIAHHYDTFIDGVEIDPKLTEIGQKYFDLDLSEHKRSVYHKDARAFLLKNNKQYDLIISDVFTGHVSIPFHLSTIEYMQLISDSLTDDGILAINIPFYSVGTVLEDYYHQTLLSTFKSVYSKGGHVLYAFKKKVSIDELNTTLQETKIPAQLVPIALDTINALKPVETNFAKVFTDDLAPVEKLRFEILGK